MTAVKFPVGLFVALTLSACGAMDKLEIGYQRNILHKYPVRGDAEQVDAPKALSLIDIEANASQTLTISQPLDHFTPGNQQTVMLRYFVNSDFAEGPNAPVILAICGESPCSARDMVYWAMAEAKLLHAHMIALEHRYYGGSYPSLDLNVTANLAFLTSDQATEDLAAFVKAEKGAYPGPWIALGGSYSGYLSAYLRAKHPEAVVGALASSAPINWHETDPAYDDYVAKALPADCAAATRTLVENLDAAAAAGDQATLDATGVPLGAPAGSDLTYVGAILRNIAETVTQYDYHVTAYCAALAAADPVAALVKVNDDLNKRFRSGDANSGLTIPPGGASSRMWTWQKCNEFGGFYTADPDRSVSVESSAFTLDYYLGQCTAKFGALPPPPSDAALKKITTALSGASHILLTNGSEDPVSSLGITSDSSDQLARDMHTYVIANGSHCTDLNFPNPKDSASLVGARALFDQLARTWIHP